MLNLGKSQTDRGALVTFSITHCLLPSADEVFISGSALGGGRLVHQWPGLTEPLDIAHLFRLCSSRSLVQEAIKPERKVPPSLRLLVLNQDDQAEPGVKFVRFL